MKGLEIFILAGGKSSRMGSDKGLVQIKGKPMIQYLIESLNELPYPIYIIAHNAAYQEFGLKVIQDKIPEKGPLGGLLTALANTTGNSVCLLSCDMPFLKAESLKALITQSKDHCIIISSLKNRILPFPGVYPISLTSLIEKDIANNRLKLQSFIFDNHHEIFALDHFSEQNPIEFLNINTPEDRVYASYWLSKNH
ncbi:molybdopterin-guanine dinucleotide biosynthesis protein A [Aquiflexum balticum DSM 16537]|uniref:Probable molybdenum cofactor guanylyltransferase n=1 Tax=Aquiflexum balticum DSM 16537 TaxID=758820 RepID=A0A1W2HAS3_9BACT|nr:molybdenum cofactor guanylyltransferase [Aquiflexum balticum]SMD46005.1 molybdopterin-guanine dinucleotide biosynthesis protein A [Aquiflexum balticum DSM 16537]